MGGGGGLEPVESVENLVLAVFVLIYSYKIIKDIWLNESLVGRDKKVISLLGRAFRVDF